MQIKQILKKIHYKVVVVVLNGNKVGKTLIIYLVNIFLSDSFLLSW